MGVLLNIGTAFVLGLLTPLTAVCVLPLYPAFLAYLANFSNTSDVKTQRKQYAFFGLLITFGVILFMLLLGVVFTLILQVSLTKVIGIISPIAFVILGLISILLIFDIDIGQYIPKAKIPTSKNPTLNALLYGFFFGAIVIPCNPLFIASFFTRALLVNNVASNLLSFAAFGIGLGFPLLAFSLLSANWSQKIISTLTKHKRKINLVAGILMFLIALYYLNCVFNIFGLRDVLTPVCEPITSAFSEIGSRLL